MPSACDASPLPAIVRELGGLFPEQIGAQGARVHDLDRKLRAAAVRAETIRRLQTMPGVGPVTAVAVETFAPPMETFRRGRNFAAWLGLGLVPRQRRAGGKQRLRRTSEMGERDIRRLLIVDAMAVIQAAKRSAPPEGAWLARMLARKPRMLVAIALGPQDGARRLGHDGQAGGLPGSGGGDRVIAMIMAIRPDASGV